MISSLWSIFIINIGINSLLSFLTLELLVLLALTTLYIRNPRLRACCLLLPFVKLIADLGSYQFSNWALAQELNPFMSAEGTRMLSAGIWYAPLVHYPLCYIHFYLQDGQTFTLADLLCLYIGPTWTLVCAIGLLIGTLASLGYAIWQCHLSRQWLHKIESTSTLYTCPLQDSFLQASIQSKEVSIFLTASSHPPFIAKQRQPAIFIPCTLFNQLSSQEFEAIIAHEMAHLRHGDLICNSALFWTCHLFWWIPTRYFKKQLELAQEYACDRLLHTKPLLGCKPLPLFA
jgi:beta-lactamase regulating signal transducer with metallopeptidase domain